MQLPRTQSKIVLFLLLGGALTLLGGCAAMHALRENPRVSVADVRVRDIKPMETVFLLELRIQNPNDVPIDLYGINCEMEIDGPTSPVASPTPIRPCPPSAPPPCRSASTPRCSTWYRRWWT